MELITETRWEDKSEWFNALTDEMNEHLLPEHKEALEKGYTLGTYIYEARRLNERNTLGIRFPGATRGHIEKDINGVITDIKFYDSACDDVACYKISVKDAVKKYIGATIIIKE